ncbi:MAG: SUF system NifU family Fe-S cluster assembly protein [Gammaproteobacteria bacterium]|jgi:nitrogen fixation NifU-like protein|nr:SUF system NifU family Fe-S cluster assembly protein [Gammaproteobacteria bacterium]
MNELKDLYQEVIFDHNRNPRHFGKLAHASCHAEGFNPLCGDKVTVYLKFSDKGEIEDVSFDGSGCAISVATASLMSETLVGKTRAEAEALFERFHSMMMGEEAKKDAAALGKLEVLSGVKEFPSRIKCATLAWHTLLAALKEEKGGISTE